MSEQIKTLTLKGWVARNKDGYTAFYLVKPKRLVLRWWHNDTKTYKRKRKLIGDSFPEITWESEPVECEITVTINN